MTEQEIIAACLNGRLFGIVECDLHVPDHLKNYFSEMPPIYKNTVVKESDIGSFMKGYLEATKTRFKPTRYLIGSMFGEKIALITPLLAWYLRHGVLVTKIYQVVEFTPDACFKQFADRVSNDRRAGDRNADFQPVAETSKLIGNSFYGYTIMNKTKHCKVTIVNEEEAVKLINEPRFSSLDELDDDCFEVSVL